MITRRSFGILAFANTEATIRASMGPLDRNVFVERRTYKGNSGLQQSLTEVFSRNGIRTLRADDGLTFLLGFESLHQRAMAWDRVNGDPDWIRIRHQVRLSELRIYRASQPGGSIFEMSL